jgi:hypothetical protein
MFAYCMFGRRPLTQFFAHDSEYLLIENRQPLMYDTLIPQGGLAVWHIDLKQITRQALQGFPGQTGWPRNGKHYGIALLQADSNYQLEKGKTQGDRGDLFRANAKDELGPSTSSVGPYPNTGKCTTLLCSRTLLIGVIALIY